MLRTLQVQLAHAQGQAAAAAADERRLRRWVEHAMSNAAGWEQRAVLALRAGDDVLARQALGRNGQWQREAAAYEGQWRDQKQSVDAIRRSLDALSDRIQTAHRDRNALVARTAAAHARLRVAQTMAQLDSLQPGEYVAAIEAQTAELEAQADLFGMGVDPLEARFAALERRGGRSGPVEDELAALKASMGLTRSHSRCG